MSVIWNYFKKEAGVAYCKTDGCKYSKELPPQTPTTFLISHLKSKHEEQHKQFLVQNAERRTNKSKPTNQSTIKRAFENLCSTSTTEPILIEEIPKKQQKIELSIGVKSIYV